MATLDYLPSPTLVILSIPILFILFKHILSKTTKTLPPGPKPWPIIGNLTRITTMPHVALAHFAKSYGPLISIRLGSQLVIVGSSPAAASEILRAHDKELSGRMVPHVSSAKDPELNKDSIAWNLECTERWRFYRTLMKNELFSSKIIDGLMQTSVREKKARELINFISSKEGQKLKIREVVFVYTFNVLANIYFSQDIIGFEGGESTRISGIIREMMELFGATNVSDLYPFLGRFDLQGLNKKTSECINKIREIWETIVKVRRETKVNSGGDGNHDEKDKRDFLDVMLTGGLSDEQINLFFMDMLAAVSDSNSSTVEWALSELMRNPSTMQRLCEELIPVFKPENTIKEPDVAKLPYLHACVKETLRLHPPAPLLLPHRAIKDVTVMNYTIPKDSQVFVNVWAIARDPKYWEEPLQFKPERFLESDLDYKGNNFEYLPFGSGRRICAGLPLAVRAVQMVLAALVGKFDWRLSDDENWSEIDMRERYGVTLMKEVPLVLVPKKRY